MASEPRSASAIVGASVTGHHVLHVESYSPTKEELPTGKFISSCPFRVGGRSWSMLYYPNGHDSGHADSIVVFLQLDASDASDDPPAAAPVRARARFSLLDQDSKLVPSHTGTTGLTEFSLPGRSLIGFALIRRDLLEKSQHLRDDCFKISCDVIIHRELRTEDRNSSPRAPPLVAVPPPDLNRHLGDLLAAEHDADVTFQVAGETFRAHRCILAARSSVFKAQLLGAMREGTSSREAPVRVADMDPRVFRALLAFLYTDALPDDLPGQGEEEEAAAAMAQHLLVAADRYDLKRLKLICEEKLCKHIDTGSVATILALAEQHNCCGLKKACFRFISSPSTLNDALATDGFQHLARSCPSLLQELLSNTCTLKQTSYWYRVSTVFINQLYHVKEPVCSAIAETPVVVALVERLLWWS
ncbi:BTB/POZ and MATH domain-containing protein 3-like [Panicum miliaceum]|uniref:BTB/POZ and MATH domain-containing protein 3-like n=1 Tax=Panicum miliaceum TaxID=4540 RepID=A0A3L6QDM4_PANMI|nr:BTB/POZ and MATH domain-containing protein 3-like [Panicum miliaceum]